METDSATVEEANFEYIAETRTTSSAANHTAGGNEAAELDDTKPVGPGIIIPVYPGDTLDLDVWGYFEGGSGYNTSTPFGMATNIANSFGGVNGGTGETGAIYNGLTSALAALGFGGTNDDSRPAAYLNYIVLDENYAYANDNAFGYVQIPASASFSQQQMSIPGILIDKIGYIFVYVSYESQVHNRVYFDDLQITHRQSDIIQSNDFYPFGLQTANSYQRATSLDNRYLYNQGTGDKTFNTERISDLDLEVDMTRFRMYDPALGRFWQVDPKADQAGQESWTPYQYGFDNPVRYNDPLGDCPDCPSPQAIANEALGELEAMYNTIAYNVSSAVDATVSFVSDTKDKVVAKLEQADKAMDGGSGSVMVAKGISGDDSNVRKGTNEGNIGVSPFLLHPLPSNAPTNFVEAAAGAVDAFSNAGTIVDAVEEVTSTKTPETKDRPKVRVDYEEKSLPWGGKMQVKHTIQGNDTLKSEGWSKKPEDQ